MNVQQLLLGLALLAGLCWNFARASEINNVRLETGATGTRVEVAMDGAGKYSVLSLANPDRLVLDLPDAQLRKGVALPAGQGVVKAVRSGHPVPGTTRIVFDLASRVVALAPRIEKDTTGSRLILEWPGDSAAAARPAVAATPKASPDSTTSSDAAVAAALLPAPRPAAEQPAPDPALASADATSRLVAATAKAASAANPPATPAQAPVFQTTVAAQPSLASAAPPPVLASVTPQPGTIATGIPTRIATGVPAPIASTSSAPSTQPDNAPSRVVPPRVNRPGINLRPLIVAIDPGHGGQDPGAIGPTGKREKDVTLAIGRELARQINATPGLKAYMTRDTDVFIPLNRRAALAREHRADIFVSVHADAAENHSATGSSVYVLSLRGASSQRARWLADKENSADLIGGRMATPGDTLASVLLDLTQSGHMKASEDAAGHVLRSIGSVNNTRRIEKANFAVLRTADMPSMLVETAFISNATEERQLTDPAYQRSLAGAVLGGINTYFMQQPPPGTMYASRAAADAATGGNGGGP